MKLRLGDTDVLLQSNDERIRRSWRTLFANSPEYGPRDEARDHLRLLLHLAPSLSPPPVADRLYRDPQNIVDVYRREDDAFALHFRRGALVHIAPDRTNIAQGRVTLALSNSEQLEDVVFTSLAPRLRRAKLYLLHAAAAAIERGIVLLVGPSHSGKTTTGLALLLGGCRHLASDVILLSQDEEGVLAHPTPGVLSARPKSFELLPGLRRFLPDAVAEKPIRNARRLHLPLELWGEAGTIAAICFPELNGATSSSLHPLPAPVALARLMEESVDRWDTASLSQHMSFLERLCRQAPAYRLILAPDVERLPELLASVP